MASAFESDYIKTVDAIAAGETALSKFIAMELGGKIPFERHHNNSKKEIILVDPFPTRPVEQERKQLQEHLIKFFKDTTAADLELFEQRCKENGVSKAEVAKTYHQLNLMLANSASAKLSLDRRALVADQIILNASYPQVVSQGEHGTCALTAMERVLYWRQPSKVAEVIKEAVLTGRYLDLDSDGSGGKNITLPASTFCPGEEESRGLKLNGSVVGDGRRNFASQIFQITVGNMISQRRSNPQIYEQHAKSSQFPTGETLTDRHGRTISSGGASAVFSELSIASARLSGRANIFLVNRLILPDEGTFGSAKELGHLLHERQKDLPLILLVNTGGSPGSHVVVIESIQGNKVFVGNEWGAGFNKWMTIDSLYDATK